MRRSLLYAVEYVFLCRRPLPCDAATPPVGSIPIDPLSSASALSQTFFLWASGLIATGLRRPMHLSDVWDVRESERAEVACEELSALWEEVLRQHGQHASVARVVFHSVRSQMQWVLFWKMGWLLFGMVSNVYLLGASLCGSVRQAAATRRSSCWRWAFCSQRQPAPSA